MKPTVLIISGWAHGIEAIHPMGDALADPYDVQLMTGSEVLKTRSIPAADFIVTGSMGGLLAMELLPARCDKLVLISSTAKFCSAEGYPCGTHERILKRMIAALKRDPETVLNNFYRNVHHPNSFHTFTGVKQPLEDLVEGLEYLLAADVRDMVPSIRVPALILHGARDRIIPVGAAEWLSANMPNGELRIFADDGHALPAHRFDESMTLIRAFLNP